MFPCLHALVRRHPGFLAVLDSDPSARCSITELQIVEQVFGLVVGFQHLMAAIHAAAGHRAMVWPSSLSLSCGRRRSRTRTGPAPAYTVPRERGTFQTPSWLARSREIIRHEIESADREEDRSRGGRIPSAAARTRFAAPRHGRRSEVVLMGRNHHSFRRPRAGAGGGAEIGFGIGLVVVEQLRPTKCSPKASCRA